LTTGAAIRDPASSRGTSARGSQADTGGESGDDSPRGLSWNSCGSESDGDCIDNNANWAWASVRDCNEIGCIGAEASPPRRRARIDTVRAPCPPFAKVDALNAEPGDMTPLAHLAWAKALPLSVKPGQLPRALREAAEERDRMSEREVALRREAAWCFWERRKRMMDADWQVQSPPEAGRLVPERARGNLGAWQDHVRELPAHIQSVLGLDKNLWLLQAGACANSGARGGTRVVS